MDFMYLVIGRLNQGMRLTPKGPNVPGVTKPVIGNVT
jgi:hypothetical protein